MGVAVAAAAPAGAESAVDSVALLADPGPGGGKAIYPELCCVQHLLAPAELAAAELRAERVGLGADQALIAAGRLDEDTYVRALAAALNTEFEPLDDVTRAQCPLDDTRLVECAAAGLLPLTIGGTLSLILAPRGISARRICQLARDNRDWSKRFRFTTGERLVDFILRNATDALMVHGRERLKTETPLFSAGVIHRTSRNALIAILLLLAAAMMLAPAATFLVISLTLAFLFLAWLGLRLRCALVRPRRRMPLARIPDDKLPIYTIIAALYREAASVEGLLRAIMQFDYPHEKLDVILAVEADDHATREAIACCGLHLPVRVVVVPAAEPRTKPKALNIALPFARGAFTVVYDAEDRPEPDQLRRALETFCAYGDDLACVQARLCIDNIADSWLTRLFAAEYAGQFDVLLDGLVSMRLPPPLGGSSNHFYTDALRKIGAWDPYNVTEDADLGMRLARLGYRAVMTHSTTYEEAPAALGPWLRQRTRWFKGWIQTWCVHIRQPVRLLRELGLAGFLSFQLVIGCHVLSALVHPIFLVALVLALTYDLPAVEEMDIATASVLTIYAFNAVAGYLVSALIGCLGLKRRGLLSIAWCLLLMPLNWLLLSFSAWRALYQFTTAPFVWEKTEHGLARSSRRAETLARPLVALERTFRDSKIVDQIPLSADSSW